MSIPSRATPPRPAMSMCRRQPGYAAAHPRSMTSRQDAAHPGALRYSVALGAIPLFTHYAWESLQCPLFVHRAEGVPMSAAMIRASLGDVLLTWVAQLMLAVATRRWVWPPGGVAMGLAAAAGAGGRHGGGHRTVRPYHRPMGLRPRQPADPRSGSLRPASGPTSSALFADLCRRWQNRRPAHCAVPCEPPLRDYRRARWPCGVSSTPV